MRSPPRAPTRFSVFRCSERGGPRQTTKGDGLSTGARYRVLHSLAEGGPFLMAPQSISVYLNNALKPTTELVELDGEGALPNVIRDMPEEVTGHFVALDPAVAHDIEAAWKRVMMLNATHVLYTFTYNPATGTFAAHKR
jgi:hypothetical protein